MTKTQTVTERFYLQWHAEDHDKGAWRATDGAADRQFLDRWTLASPDTSYTFEFGAQHSSSHPYTVFAVLTDSAGPVHGVRIEPNRPSSETVLVLQVAGSELAFEAGQLVSDDPKMEVSPNKPASALTLIWSVAANGEYAWTYELDGRDPVRYVEGEPIEIGADSTGAVAITVLDRSPDAALHTCAVYYGEGPRSPSGTTNAGSVGQIEAVGSDGQVVLGFVPAQSEFTLNLFASLATNKATVLRRG